MNNVFLFILSSIKAFLTSEFASYIVIFILPSVLLTVLTMLTVQLISKKPCKLGVFNWYLVVLTVVLFNVFLSNNVYVKKLFSSFLDFSIYVSAFTILALSGNVSLSVLRRKGKKAKKNCKLLQAKSEKEVEKAVEIIPCIEEPVSVYSGYIDVSYVKGLIDKLKESRLELHDEKEIEELEIFLLNFVNRQPNASERKILSEYMSSLIKKLAKYNAI